MLPPSLFILEDNKGYQSPKAVLMPSWKLVITLFTLSSTEPSILFHRSFPRITLLLFLFCKLRCSWGPNLQGTINSSIMYAVRMALRHRIFQAHSPPQSTHTSIEVSILSEALGKYPMGNICLLLFWYIFQITVSTAHTWRSLRNAQDSRVQVAVSQTCIFLKQENQLCKLFEVVCEEAYLSSSAWSLAVYWDWDNWKPSIIQFLKYYNESHFVYRYI